MVKMKKLVLAMCCLLGGYVAEASIRLPRLFSDGMVLQQRSEVRIWGWAAPGYDVEIVPSWDSRIYKTTAGVDGCWQAEVITPAAGGPYEMTVSDGEPVVLHDILIGEVWICSGQSNMAMKVKGNRDQPTAGALETIMYSGKYADRIRCFQVDLKVSDTLCNDLPGGRWMASQASETGDFSAVAYYFARYLTDVLGVPVGIIVNAWGWSIIESWLDAESLTKTGAQQTFDASRLPQHKHSGIYNSLVYPMAGYGAKGFLWYQGESNRTAPELYPQQLEALVSKWRSLWNNDSMPFYVVQIAPYSYDDKDAEVAPVFVDSLLCAADRIPHCNVVGTTDIGNEFCVHTSAKDIVGFRLAHMALCESYHLYGDARIPPTGPRLKRIEPHDDQLRLVFDQALSPSPRGIAGLEAEMTDGSIVPVKGKVMPKNNVVAVTVDHVESLKYLRYAYRNYMEADLASIYGLPAFPFRVAVNQRTGN